MDVLEALVCVDGVCEEDAGCKEGGDECSDTLDGLCEVQSDFAVSGWSADGKKPILLANSHINILGWSAYGSAAVSRVERPAPTTWTDQQEINSVFQVQHTNMLPQNPTNDFFTPLGQNRRQPTARVARPDGQQRAGIHG